MRQRALIPVAALALVLSLACTASVSSVSSKAPAPRASGDTLRSAYEKPPSEWPKPWIDEGVAFVELGTLEPPTSSSNSNPYTQHAQLARIGRQLFFDTRLSADGRIACASCHRPDQGWTVRTPTASGVGGQQGQRNPPGLQHVASRLHWAWDGAVGSLAAQSLRPLTDPREMGNPSLDTVWQRLRSAPRYNALTQVDDPMRTGEALAAFQRTLHTASRFDRFAKGDSSALNDQQIQGLHLFRTRARCANCHFGPTLSDGQFHNLGIAFFGEPSQDLGRHGVTRQCDDVGRFRTPSLRQVSRTAPYMHNGLFDSLAGVLHLYVRGGGEARSGRASARADPLYACALRVSPHLQPLPLSAAEIEALQAFLLAV